ncbi:MFS transporter [Kitasatospora sp. NBC_01266]|uniref:MFS transporter n=1 Tax=Kitasatospora sp. NBC_01266 TaxID=2903572 RepID=UPI002E345DF6|nr:MFS transporter [Kitasatospora sp. NBC_01266]
MTRTITRPAPTAPVDQGDQVRAAAEQRQGLGTVFWTLWGGRGLSALGGYMQFLALPLWIQGTTGSALAGIVAFVIFTLPKLVISPFAGVIADRFERRKVVVVTDLASALVVAGMTAAVPGRHIVVLYALLGLLQVLAAVRVPALASVVPDAIPAGRLLTANALLDATTGASMVVGPLLGTALLASAGIQWVLVANAATFVVAALCMAPIPACPPSALVPAYPLQAIRQGVSALLSDPVLRFAVLSEGTIYLLFGAVTELLALDLARRGGAHSAGMFGMGGGIGWIAVTLVLSRLRRTVSSTALLLAGAASALPVAGLVVLLTGHPAVALCAALAGLLVSVHSFVYGLGPVLLCQQRPADGVRGRVLATRRTWNALWQLVAFAVGAGLSERWSSSTVILLGGLAATAAAVPTALLAYRAEAAARPAGHPAPTERSRR